LAKKSLLCDKTVSVASEFIIFAKYYCDSIREDEMGGHVAYMEEFRNTSEILVGKPERNRSIGKNSVVRKLQIESVYNMNKDDSCGYCEHGDKPSDTMKGGEFLYSILRL
jgi:hypothetical protein